MYYTYIIKREQQTHLFNLDNLFDNSEDSIFEEIKNDPRHRRFYNRRTVRVNLQYDIPKHLSTNRAYTIWTRKVAELLLTTKITAGMYKDNKDKHYSTFHIPKRTGGYREIQAPSGKLKEDMRIILHKLNEMDILPHVSAYAYIKGVSIKDVMEYHQYKNARWFLKLDIKDFFGSFDKELLTRLLSNIYPFAYINHKYFPHPVNGNRLDGKDLVDSLVDLALYQGKLPQGTPLSPFLTNIAMVPIDHAITKLLRDKYPKLNYTRYADDIIISGHTDFSNVKSTIEAEVSNILEGITNSKLNINTGKTRYGSNAGRNWNLGLMYNKEGNITIGHRRKKRIKAGIHNFLNNKEEYDLETTQVLLGEISYLKQIEPEYADYLLKTFDTDVWYTIVEHIKSFNN